MAGDNSVLALDFLKCQHSEEKKMIIPLRNATTFLEVFDRFHGDTAGKSSSFQVKTKTDSGQGHDVLSSLTVGEIVHLFNVRHFVFTCTCELETKAQQLSEINVHAKVATKKAVNAFELMMAGGRSFPSKKKSSSGMKAGLSRKDELYNKLIDKFTSEGLDFPKSTASTDGSYFVQVMCNALWYTTNHHATIDDAAKHKAEVHSFPQAFSAFDGFNDIKRKKHKSLPMTSSELASHSEALYSLLMKPVINSSATWKTAGTQISELADCLSAYSNYLKNQTKVMLEHHANDHPARTIDKDATVEHRHKCSFGVKPMYVILDEAMKAAGENTPVFFDEHHHVENLFPSNQHRARFLKDLQLSMPVDMVRFSPGGSSLSIVCLMAVQASRSLPEMLTQTARFLQTARPRLKEFHTRAQRRHFKEQLKNVASVLPSVCDMIYKELAMDAAIAAHPITQERLRLIFLGNTGLVRDLRSLNPGRPSGKFDTFFDALSGQIENITAADDRRHGVAHLSEFISLKEMITKAKNECPEGTPIPSKSLVRLQFAPRNPYSKTAHNFTSRINVQHKIQRRQLRVSHPDDHYCNAQFKYLKQKAINQQNCTLLFCDDKAKVPFGDPGHLISTGVRGKKTIVPSTTTLVALDHDMNHSSLTPSVILQCDIPKEINDSFVRGQVTTVINDSVLQQSSPFRHNAVLAKLLAEKETMQPILMKFTDGGTDQRNNIESVKCATICLFRELNLDMIILGRCAPGHSYVNPAERVMSILNLGLQNVALQREVSDEESEKYFKRCNGMADMRELLNTKKPELKQSWIDVVEPVQSIIRNRFLRLSLKDVPFAAMDPVPDTDIDLLKRHLRELFPDLDLQKLTKAHASKVESYTSWMASHSRSRHYTFQVRKCEDLSCCSAPTLPREQLNWLPDPVLDASGDHYRPYSEVEDMDTDEKDRPSLKAAPKRKEKRTADVGQPAAAENRGEGATAVDREPATSDQQEEDAALPEPDPHLCTSQNARAVVTCVECQKPRVIYSRHKLTDRQTMTVALATSEFEYTCGSPLLPPTTSLYTKVMCRSNITCSTTVELQFYASSLGRTDICCFCTAENSDVDTQLLKKYKTVLPMCASCTSKGKQAVVARPF